MLNKQDILKPWDFLVCGQDRHRIFLGVTNFIEKKPLVLSLFILNFSIKEICRDEGFVKIEHGVILYKKYGNSEPLLIINGGRDFLLVDFCSRRVAGIRNSFAYGKLAKLAGSDEESGGGVEV